MDECNCYLFIFDSTHHALSGEKALKEAGIMHAVINTPREFSSHCGISLRVAPELKEDALEAIEGKGVICAEIRPYNSRWIQNR